MLLCHFGKLSYPPALGTAVAEWVVVVVEEEEEEEVEEEVDEEVEEEK